MSAKRSSSSPIEDISPSKSAHFSNTGILPKRVTPSSADEDCHLSLVSKQNTKVRQNFHQSNDSLVRTSSVNDRSLELSCIKEFVGGPLLCSKEPQLEVLLDKSFENENYESLRKPPIQKCNISNFIRLTNTDGFLSSSNNTNRWAVSYGSKSSFLMTTSTPAPSNGCFVTPVVDKNNSMSPITKSTRRMPKAMQVIG